MRDFKERLYEEWMESQVIDLFISEYGGEKEKFKKYFKSLYESNYQKNLCIRVVSVDGEKIVGFQSYFYWPLKDKLKTIKSYQSGNSLVHPEYRGCGIFKSLLNFINLELKRMNPDVLIGFPVEASFNSFVRNGWSNPFNLRWYLKVVNPFAIILDNLGQSQELKFPVRDNADVVSGLFRPYSTEFDNKVHVLIVDHKLRAESESEAKLINKIAKKSNKIISIGFRLNPNVDAKTHKKISTGKDENKFAKRKSIFGELIIGEVDVNTDDVSFIKRGLKALIKESRKNSKVLFISCALNPNYSCGFNNIIKKSFINSKREIYFITKLLSEDITEPELQQLNLYRGDIDTW